VSQSRPTISTHVLDTGSGDPARGVTIRLWRLAAGGVGAGGDGGTALVREAMTDDDGRVRDLLSGTDLEPGGYRVEFDVDRGGFFTRMAVDLRVEDVSRSYHVPLLLAPFGLSTYRGS
jgi:5-hydroxyisourate hydrolase